MNILKYFLFVAVICLEIVLSSIDFWIFTYFSPLLILASYYLFVNKETSAISILLFGTIALDLLNGRNVGLIASSFLLAVLIVELISRQISMLDNQSKTIKIVLVLVFYIVIYFGQMILKNILSAPQVIVLATIYLITLVNTIILVKTLSKSKKNVIKI